MMTTIVSCEELAAHLDDADWRIFDCRHQLSAKDYVSIRNEYFDDIAGQRTGYKSRYTEHAVSYNRWIGSTVLFRPELRFEHAYDQPAYDGGTRKTQLSLAADFLFFY